MATENPAIPGEQPETPFHDLDHYLAIPRVSGLSLSPDGRRLVTTVSTLNGKGTEFATALWELDPSGERHARRITRSAKGEAGAAFAANGDVYFTSARPDPDSPEGDPVSALWLLPADGGEARVVLSRPGGVGAVMAARNADATFVTAELLAGSTDEENDAERRKSRKDNKVSAILHSEYPVRYWDADLGPGQPRIFAVEPGDDKEPGKPATVDAAPPLQLRNLTPDAGPRLREAETVVSPDGRTIYTSYTRPLAKADSRSVLVAVDVATGKPEGAPGRGGHELLPGPCQPGREHPGGGQRKRHHPARGSRRSSCTCWTFQATADGPAGNNGLTPLVPDWDRWAKPAAWLPDGSALLVTADDDGASPVFRISVPASAAEVSVTRVTQDAAAYTDVVVSPEAAAPMRCAAPTSSRPRLSGSTWKPGRPPGCPPRRNGRSTPAGWSGWPQPRRTAPACPPTWRCPTARRLSRPRPCCCGSTADRWDHGMPGPGAGTPGCSRRKGYAVLLPDPALSTGYGQAHIQRGWGEWGKAPFTDLMAVTDTAVERPDIDESRTAAMGGSFGGYMANWVAGQTDRFKAIVTHASLWALDQFGPTTDASQYWLKEMTEEMALDNSPHLHVEKISTPMLVIHGDKDYRVPIGEGLRLWYELLSKSHLAADQDGQTPHRFLYFPDENHWILQPQHAKVWYGVVESFLAKNVLDQDLPVPAELGL